MTPAYCTAIRLRAPEVALVVHLIQRLLLPKDMSVTGSLSSEGPLKWFDWLTMSGLRVTMSGLPSRDGQLAAR